MISATGPVEDLRVVQRSLHEIVLEDGADDFCGRERGLGLDDRDLGDVYSAMTATA